MEEQKSNIPQPKAEPAPKTPAPQKQPGAASVGKQKKQGFSAEELQQKGVKKTQPQEATGNVGKLNNKNVKVDNSVRPENDARAAAAFGYDKNNPPVKTNKKNELANKAFGDYSNDKVHPMDYGVQDFNPNDKKVQKIFSTLQGMLQDGADKKAKDSIYDMMANAVKSGSDTEDIRKLAKYANYVMNTDASNYYSKKGINQQKAAIEKNAEKERLKREESERAEKELAQANADVYYEKFGQNFDSPIRKNSNVVMNYLTQGNKYFPPDFISMVQKDLRSKNDEIKDPLDYVNKMYSKYATYMKTEAPKQLSRGDKIMRFLFGDMYR